LHGSRLYDEQLRVPLIVHDTGGSLDGLRIDALVAHADVFASLLEVAGRDAPADPASGTSFVPLLRGEQWTGRRYAFSERRYFAPGASGSIKPVAGLDREPRKLQAPMPFSIEALFREGYRNAFDPGEKYALQDERYKYIHHTLYGDELYDLVHDPLELENLIGRGLPEEKRLLEELLSSVRALTRRGGDATSIDRESFEALEALGYVE
jgi:arylsulfatase A-like enzyme